MNWRTKPAGTARTFLAAMVAAMTLAPAALAEDNDMQAWIDEQIASGKNLAITAMHLKDGEVSYYAGGTTTAGEQITPDENTQFQMGSITKPFTDMLLAELVANGAVKYDTTIGELMDVEPKNPAVAEITLQSLATHTSGLPRLPVNLVPANPLDPYAGYDDDLLKKAVVEARNLQPLGDHYAYSNFGVGLLGYLLGEEQGDGYQKAMMALVVEPLGLTETGFTESGNVAQGFRSGDVVPAWSMDDALAGAGSLWGSVSDF
ncbi:MAG: serine hydrolase domain-containing protein, partial [Pseudomonadota bacterium]